MYRPRTGIFIVLAPVRLFLFPRAQIHAFPVCELGQNAVVALAEAAAKREAEAAVAAAEATGADASLAAATAVGAGSAAEHGRPGRISSGADRLGVRFSDASLAATATGGGAAARELDTWKVRCVHYLALLRLMDGSHSADAIATALLLTDVEVRLCTS